MGAGPGWALCAPGARWGAGPAVLSEGLEGQGRAQEEEEARVGVGRLKGRRLFRGCIWRALGGPMRTATKRTGCQVAKEMKC